jgi:hypothetical protein
MFLPDESIASDRQTVFAGRKIEECESTTAVRSCEPSHARTAEFQARIAQGLLDRGTCLHHDSRDRGGLRRALQSEEYGDESKPESFH